MSDTARALLTAAMLSSTALGVYVWKLTQLDPTGPERLVAQLRLAQWSALALAALGSAPLGLAVAHETGPFGTLEVASGLIFLIIAAVILQREPREALFLASIAFASQALFSLVHRPGMLAPMAPTWFTAGCATYDLVLAGLCYWARRR